MSRWLAGRTPERTLHLLQLGMDVTNIKDYSTIIPHLQSTGIVIEGAL